MAKRKKNKSSSKRSAGGGSMVGMRSGFQGMFGKKKKGQKADPMQFAYILAGLFALFALIFLGTR